MKLLAIETSTDACSAALLIDDEVKQHHRVAPREHATRILPMCESLLDEAGIALADLDCIAFGRGPGSFTGVRIACSVAQGLAFSCDLPVMAISTLAALAQAECMREQKNQVLAALDARMGELYLGAYMERDGVPELLGEEQVGPASAIRLPEAGSWWGAGSGWGAYAKDLAARMGELLLGFNAEALPEARAVAHLAARGFERGEAVPAEQAGPVYLRDKVAEKPKS